MRALLEKELRSALPFLLLLVAIYVFGSADAFVSSYPDQLAATKALSYTTNADAHGITVVSFLMSMVLAAGLIVGEKDRGTLELLDALPTTRSAVFLAKIVAGWTVLAALPVLEVLVSVIVRSLSRTSLDPSFHFDILGVGVLLHFCQLGLLFGLALNLAYLRRFSWLIAAALVIAYQVAIDVEPALGILDVVAFVEPSFEGMGRRIPMRQLQLFVALAVFFHGTAWLLFTAGGDRLLDSLASWRETRRGRGLLAVALFASVVTWFTVAYLLFQTNGPSKRTDGEIPGATLSTPQTQRAWTEHYRFTHHSDRVGRARALIDVAERVHEDVRRRFDIEPIDLIEVDLTRSLSAHRFAGVTTWKQIQIDLDAVGSSTLAVEILAHETAHVYAAKASDLRLPGANRWTRFFNEGLAEWLGLTLANRTSALDDHELRAGLKQARRELSVDVLIDDELLTTEHHEDLAYSLGVEFIRAIVERWGEGAPFAIVRAFGRKEAPEDLAGIVLWRDVFQAAGYDFDEAVARFFDRLDRYASTWEDMLAKIPRLQAVLHRDAGHLVASALYDPEASRAGWKLICRFRPKRSSAPTDYATVPAGDDGTCRIRRRFFPTGTVHLQLGATQFGIAIFERWSEVPLPD